MRTQDIEIILAVRSAGSFSRAADELELSQPAVSLAVKRVEEELGARVFDRSGPVVTLTSDGQRVVRGFDRILEILNEIKVRREEASVMRFGLSPLLSGRDVAKLLDGAFRNRSGSFAIEFLDTQDIVARSDFDAMVVLPGLRRRAGVQLEFHTAWIGADNGTFIRSRQEAVVWDRASHVLIDQGIQITKIIEVNDCGYAYHLASSGAGFTPCVMTRDNAFADYRIDHLPPLPPIKLDVFADPETARLMQISLGGRNG